MSPLADVEQLVIEGRYGHADLALRRLEALIPGLAQSADVDTLLLALYGRALLLRQLAAGTQSAIAACDVLERAAHERQDELWVAVACALRARFRVDSGNIGGATADLARADAAAETEELTGDTGYRLLDGVALVYAGLRLNDRADEVRAKIEASIAGRRVLDRAQHWSTWSGELAARAMEPLAGGAPDPQHELMGRAIEIAARLDELPEADVPATLRRGARGVRALSAAYRGRPSEALRLLGPDAFGTVGDLPLVERQVVSLAAMRAHALVGSLATARSLDDAATTPPSTLPNLVLEVCRTRERLWLETYAGGDVIPVLHRMTELLVRLGWRGMDLVADTARQALEHQALRTESRTDALTGVGNRRALDEELRQLLRFGQLPLALILVDIDHFKEVNDRFTHIVGDEVLRRVAASLSLQLRTDDQLLRYGGDEFVVLLPGTGDEEANAVAERMAAAVAARPWGELADGLQVTITTGVAAVWSLSGRRPDSDAEKLFRRADERLLHAKRTRPEASRDRGRSSASPEITVEVSEPAVACAPPAPLPVTSSLPMAPAAAAPADGDTPAPLTMAPNSVSRARAAGDPGQRTRSEQTTPEGLSVIPAVADEPPIIDRRAGDGHRPRDAASHAAIPARSPQPPHADRGKRAAFDPDPDIDLDGPPSAASGRRRAPSAHTSHSADEPDPLNRTGSFTSAARSRREARAAVRPGGAQAHESAHGPDAAEAAAAAREVGRAQADEAADRERAEREHRERDEQKERAAPEAGARVAAARAAEEATREEAARERAVRDQAARERAEHEEAARRQAEREQAAREQAARERAVRDQAEREQAAREQAAREQAAREQAEREQAARDQAEREQAAREQAAREQAAREQTDRERLERARLARERLEQERLERERAERARLRREAAERAAGEQAAREQAQREAAERERRRAAEQARRDVEARKERERQEADTRLRAELAQREYERMEAVAAANRIREEAYARSAAQREEVERTRAEDRARRAERAGARTQTEEHARHDAYTETPLFRRAPLYDSHNPSADLPAEPPDSGETVPTRIRRDPFGPPTSRQAIIDLSSRKRPRNPYSN